MTMDVGSQFRDAFRNLGNSWHEIAKVRHTKPSTFNPRIMRTQRISKRLRKPSLKSLVTAPRRTGGARLAKPGIRWNAHRRAQVGANRFGLTILRVAVHSQFGKHIPFTSDMETSGELRLGA